MILFFDGPDGSGKSTLLSRVAAAAPAHGLHPVVAPPLWTFVEPIAAPEDFAPWVTRTPAVEVARHLLDAMSRRIEALVDHDLPHTGSPVVKLVDRGPRTVLCSALAHTATTEMDGVPTGRNRDLDEGRRGLDAMLTRLASVDALFGVELRPPGVSLTIERLSELEHLTGRYIEYLGTLARAFEQVPRHRHVTQLVLPAERTVDRNTSAVIRWLSDHAR